MPTGVNSFLYNSLAAVVGGKPPNPQTRERKMIIYAIKDYGATERQIL